MRNQNILLIALVVSVTILVATLYELVMVTLTPKRSVEGMRIVVLEKNFSYHIMLTESKAYY